MKRFFAGLLVAVLLLAGCALNNDDLRSRNFTALDTDISIYAEGEEAEAALNAAKKEVLRLEGVYSPNSSDLTTLNSTGTATVSDELAGLITRGQSLSFETSGCFSLTVGPLVEAWGFESKDYRVPSREERTALMQKVDDSQINIQGNTITIPEGWGVDVGGIAKGAISDSVMDVMRTYNIDSAAVSLGGNVQLSGPQADGSPWRIGIQDPEDTNALCANFEASEACAVITSGGYERYFESDGIEYHHIIDPRTGMPATGQLTSVTIISPDGTLADALSTALYVMDLEGAMRYWQENSQNFECILVDRSNNIYVSEGIAAKVSAENGYNKEVIAL